MRESYSSLAKSFIAGSFSGTCSTILFQPLDLLKTRLQLCDKTQHVATNRSFIRLAVQIVRHEHVFGLWRGLVPSLYRTVPGIGVYFCSLHWLSHKSQSRELRTPLESLTMGACARSISGFTTLPFTVVKARFESGIFNYRSVIKALTSIYRIEGCKGLFNGLLATLLRDVPFSGLYFMFYSQAKNVFAQSELVEMSDPHHPEVIPPPSPPLPLVNFGCGVMAGCLASIITHPADVIKTRLQLQPVTSENVRGAVRSILHDFGAVGFLRGLLPRLLRRTLMAAMSWTVYEQVMLNLNLR